MNFPIAIDSQWVLSFPFQVFRLQHPFDASRLNIYSFVFTNSLVFLQNASNRRFPGKTVLVLRFVSET